MLVIQSLFLFFTWGVTAVIVAAIVLIVMRSVVNYMDVNPFSWLAVNLRRSTEPVLAPVRAVLRGFRLDPKVAPFIAVILIIVAGYLVVLVVGSILNTIAGIIYAVSSRQLGAPVAIIGYLLFGFLSLYRTAATSASPDDSKELLQLARIYDQFARSWLNIGTAPATPPTEAYTALIKAHNFDSAATFKTEIDAKPRRCRPEGGGQLHGQGPVRRGVRRRAHVGEPERLERDDKPCARSSSPRLASSHVGREGDAVRGREGEASGRSMKMVESKSQWHQKAAKLLSSS